MNEEKELMEKEALPPRKKGLLRLFELLDRDSGKFFKAGIFCFFKHSLIFIHIILFQVLNSFLFFFIFFSFVLYF